MVSCACQECTSYAVYDRDERIFRCDCGWWARAQFDTRPIVGQLELAVDEVVQPELSIPNRIPF